MASNKNGASPTGQKASFTVSQAAKAFRKARNGGVKVELVESDGRFVRRDRSGRFVLVKTQASTRKSDSKVSAGYSRKR